MCWNESTGNRGYNVSHFRLFHYKFPYIIFCLSSFYSPRHVRVLSQLLFLFVQLFKYYYIYFLPKNVIIFQHAALSGNMNSAGAKKERTFLVERLKGNREVKKCFFFCFSSRWWERVTKGVLPLPLKNFSWRAKMLEASKKDLSRLKYLGNRCSMSFLLKEKFWSTLFQRFFLGFNGVFLSDSLLANQLGKCFYPLSGFVNSERFVESVKIYTASERGPKEKPDCQIRGKPGTLKTLAFFFENIP